MKRVLAVSLCFLLAGCASAERLFERHGYERKVFVPRYPVILIPGLGYTGHYWETGDMLKELRRLGWRYGGDLKVRKTSEGIFVEPVLIGPAHIYSMTFSYPQLAVVEQGKELAKVVQRVKDANLADKVILVGHSMGGLAAREYLEAPDYGKDVAQSISLGTPHLGSNFRLEKISIELIPEPVRDIFWKVDERSDAVRDLRPQSIYLSGGNETQTPNEFRSKDVNLNGFVGDEIMGLNDFKIKSLPADVQYVSVIGSGCPMISTRQQCTLSDGIVTFNSQNLNQVPGVNVKSEVLTTDKDHFGEAHDGWVFIEALQPMLVPRDEKQP